MTIFTPIFLVLVLVESVLIGQGVIQVLLRRPRHNKVVFWAGGIAFCYAIVLVSVGYFSRPTRLSLGQRKCFDDWCFAAIGSLRTDTGVDVQAAAYNEGRRSQTPDSPRLFSIVNGKLSELVVPMICDRIEGQGEHLMTFHVNAPSGAFVEILVTEGGGPSLLIIDDENSPFHAKSSWSVTPPK